MGEHPSGKRRAFFIAALFTFSLSTAAQDMRSSDESSGHTEEVLHSGPIVEDMGHAATTAPTVPAPVPSGLLSEAGDDVTGDQKKDLTVFFAIGFIINILLISAFVFWAAGQWHRAKQE